MASGMEPMPIWRVAPSSTREPTQRPMARDTSSGGGWVTSGSGESCSTMASMASAAMKLSPRVRGMRGLTSAMITRAHSTAGFTMSTETPRLQKPCSSGGVTWMRATSMGTRPLRNRRGTSERKMGV